MTPFPRNDDKTLDLVAFEYLNEKDKIEATYDLEKTGTDAEVIYFLENIKNIHEQVQQEIEKKENESKCLQTTNYDFEQMSQLYLTAYGNDINKSLSLISAVCEEKNKKKSSKLKFGCFGL